MKADKIILVVSVFLCFLACGREDVPSTEDTVTVSLNISQEEEMNTVGTKSMFPLDPKVENPIADIWVLQYDELGQLCASDHQEKTPSLSIPDHEVTLKRRPTSTIVVFANVGDIAEDDYPWPATIALLRKSRMAVDKSLDITGGADPKRLYMVGETVLTEDKIQSEGKTSINVMLSRICCKLAIGIHQSGDEFHDIKVKIINAAKGFIVFPTVESFTDTYVDNTYYTDYTEDGTQSVGSARKYFYYYLYENMNKDRQTKIKVTVTGKDGRERIRIFPITSHGELIRNTFYTIDLELKGSGN